MKKKRLLIVLGTRPEAIKLAPLILALQSDPSFDVFVCNTEQQKELSNQTLGFFGIKPNCSLNTMTDNQTLEGLQCRTFERLGAVLDSMPYDGVIVQGDTMTVFATSLLAFYRRIPIFHVEAGLRSNNLTEPFPEEGIRQMTSCIATLHFAPTIKAREALIAENIPQESIFVTGNTVIDALSSLTPKAISEAKNTIKNIGLNDNSNYVLITIHRRENHGVRLHSILNALVNLANNYPNITFVIPVHPNPNVKSIVEEYIDGISNILATSPLDYPVLVELMRNAVLILTDSGGIQEEAPSFEVPLMVLREETERREGIEAGVASLIGTNTEAIISAASTVLNNIQKKNKRQTLPNPYGDGKAAERIVSHLKRFYKL